MQQLFMMNLADAERAVRRNVTVTVNQAQFDALVSYIFNRGATGARPVFKLVNCGDFHAAGAEMRKTTMVKVRKNGKLVLVRAKGLVDRRHEESEPFMNAPSQPTVRAPR